MQVSFNVMVCKTIAHSWLCVCVCVPGFLVEVQLDHLKHMQKGGVKRALFVDSQQPMLQRSVRVRSGERVCHETKIYLRVSALPKITTK